MGDMTTTLCFPDCKKTCFACCPPIRPASYEHAQFKETLRRSLRENTEGFHRIDSTIVPITGFSCWALGYLDRNFRQVGCLLHPGQNGGRDLRYRVNYGDKCQREVCPEAKVFSQLGLRERTFWLQLADGLDSFSYSSKRANPLFKLMGWGPHLLHLLPSKEENRVFTRKSFFESYPFFLTALSPRANAYLMTRSIRKENLHVLRTKSFRSKFEAFSRSLSERLRQTAFNEPDGLYVHLLDLNPELSDFLRLSTGIMRIRREDAAILKNAVDGEIAKFHATALA
jgi:hypothetical protein